MITILLWVFVALQFVEALATTAMVGKERKPVTPGTAALSVAVALFFGASVVILALWS